MFSWWGCAASLADLDLVTYARRYIFLCRGTNVWVVTWDNVPNSISADRSLYKHKADNAVHSRSYNLRWPPEDLWMILLSESAWRRCVCQRLFPASILYKSVAGQYRPVSYPDGPITARYRFIKNAYWFIRLQKLICHVNENESVLGLCQQELCFSLISCVYLYLNDLL